jgi:hypothetical protein
MLAKTNREQDYASLKEKTTFHAMPRVVVRALFPSAELDSSSRTSLLEKDLTP